MSYRIYWSREQWSAHYEGQCRAMGHSPVPCAQHESLIDDAVDRTEKRLDEAVEVNKAAGIDHDVIGLRPGNDQHEYSIKRRKIADFRYDQRAVCSCGWLGEWGDPTPQQTWDLHWKEVSGGC